MRTSYGLEFNTVKEINPEWSDYDKTIAECHLANTGVVIVDTEHGQPIDNEYDLEEIYRLLEKASCNTTAGRTRKPTATPKLPNIRRTCSFRRCSASMPDGSSLCF